MVDGNQKACNSEIYRIEVKTLMGERLARKINGKLMLKRTILAGDYHAIDQERRMQITVAGRDEVVDGC